MMQKKVDHTLILRTRDRTDWLAKALNQYAKLEYKGTLQIEDDSTEEYFEKNSVVIREYKNYLDIKHYQGKGFRETSRAKRVARTTRYSLERINTEFYSFGSDDDLFLASFVDPAIRFLRKYKEFSCVTGPEIKINYDSNLKIKKSIYKPWHSCEYDDPMDRIFDYSQRASLAYYGVCRTSMRDHLKEVEKQTGRKCFVRRDITDFVNYDEELPWVMLVYAAGKIHYFPNIFMGIRGIHQSPDRVTDLYNNPSFKVYHLGPIAELSQPTAWKTIRESHEDLCTLIKICGTKYSIECVEDSVMKLLWSFISRYSGAGILSSGTEYCDTVKAKREVPFILSFPGKLSRLFMRYAHKYFGRMNILLSSEIREFRKNHKAMLRS